VGVTVGNMTVSVTRTPELGVAASVPELKGVEVATVTSRVGASVGDAAIATLSAAANVTMSVGVGLKSPGKTRILWTTNAIKKPTIRSKKKAYLPKSYRQIERGGRLCAMRYSPLASVFEVDAVAVGGIWSSTLPIILSGARFARLCFALPVADRSSDLFGSRPLQSMTHSMTRPTTMPATNPSKN
jgi:hypothetical protein